MLTGSDKKNRYRTQAFERRRASYAERDTVNGMLTGGNYDEVDTEVEETLEEDDELAFPFNALTNNGSI
jgi:hypothetical protein